MSQIVTITIENNSNANHDIEANDVDVSKNTGTPKWMVYNGRPY